MQKQWMMHRIEGAKTQRRTCIAVVKPTSKSKAWRGSTRYICKQTRHKNISINIDAKGKTTLLALFAKARRLIFKLRTRVHPP